MWLQSRISFTCQNVRLLVTACVPSGSDANQFNSRQGSIFLFLDNRSIRTKTGSSKNRND